MSSTYGEENRIPGRLKSSISPGFVKEPHALDEAPLLGPFNLSESALATDPDEESLPEESLLSSESDESWGQGVFPRNGALLMWGVSSLALLAVEPHEVGVVGGLFRGDAEDGTSPATFDSYGLLSVRVGLLKVYDPLEQV